MKIVFFGNADFGLHALKSLVQSPEHEIIAVVTNPDNKVSRNKKRLKPVRKFALNNSIKLIEQDNISEKHFIEDLKKKNADIFLVVAYKIIPKEIYNIPKYGAINIHASLLPQYRGAAPIQRALMNGDNSTGISTFFINEKIDRGELIYQKKVPIKNSDSFEDLWIRLSKEGPAIIKRTLELIEIGQKELVDRSELKASYALKINKDELRINWSEEASLIYNKIRALSPYPCMYTTYDNKRIKIVSSKISNNESIDIEKPGSFALINGRLFVCCVEGFIEILELIPESKGILSAQEFINGFLSNSKSSEIEAFK